MMTIIQACLAIKECPRIAVNPARDYVRRIYILKSQYAIRSDSRGENIHVFVCRCASLPGHRVRGQRRIGPAVLIEFPSIVCTQAREYVETVRILWIGFRRESRVVEGGRRLRRQRAEREQNA